MTLSIVRSEIARAAIREELRKIANTNMTLPQLKDWAEEHANYKNLKHVTREQICEEEYARALAKCITDEEKQALQQLYPVVKEKDVKVALGPKVTQYIVGLLPIDTAAATRRLNLLCVALDL